MGAELFRTADRQRDRQADGQTDVSKLVVAFRNFANAPKLHRTLKWRLFFLPKSVSKILRYQISWKEFDSVEFVYVDRQTYGEGNSDRGVLGKTA